MKRDKRSATLSHLFNQGEVSAQLLLEDKSFREKVIGKLDGQHKALVDTDGIKPPQFTVVFAVAFDSNKPLETALPFFSRLTFAGVARRLTNYGYKVALTKIELTNSASMAASKATISMSLPSTISPAAPGP